MAKAPRAKRSVAAVVFLDKDVADPRFLAVLRPPDDDALPGVWGLPAASPREGESWESAVRRLGEAKLGVELEPVSVIARGTLQRPGYLLDMRLFEARIVKGTPTMPGDDKTVTQYVQWRWSRSEQLREGARRGSLCCRLYLSRFGSDREGIDFDSG